MPAAPSAMQGSCQAQATREQSRQRTWRGSQDVALQRCLSRIGCAPLLCAVKHTRGGCTSVVGKAMQLRPSQGRGAGVTMRHFSYRSRRSSCKAHWRWSTRAERCSRPLRVFAYVCERLSEGNVTIVNSWVTAVTILRLACPFFFIK